MSSKIVGFSSIAGGVALAVLMLPTIIRTADEAFKIVPQEIRWAALGVGAYNYQCVLKIVLPAALPGIITGGYFGYCQGSRGNRSLNFHSSIF